MSDPESVTLRDEAPGDEDAVRAVTTEAFADAPYSEGTEPGIVDGLRADGDLALSLVALRGARIVGHVAFSPVRIEAGAGLVRGWFGLGPLSVAPSVQRRGVGGALVHEGLARIRRRGARGVVLVGDPAYYARFGFEGDVGLTYGSVPAPYVQALAFEGAAPRGAIRYADAFERQ